MELIDGNAISKQIQAEVAEEVATLGGKPCVTFVRVGEDPASVSYVKKKNRIATELGIESRVMVLPEETTREELLKVIDSLNADPAVHGILVQSPIGQIKDEKEIFNTVSPLKDVDGFNAASIGKLCQDDRSAFVSCTPAGIIELLKRSGVETSGKNVAVIGRSLIVGKPVSLLLMMKAETGDATVTVCHSRTQDLPAVTRQADILIAAIGRAHYVTADMVKDGAVVIDVGINRVDDPSRKKGYRLVGDVDFDAVAPKCRLITPVPGGVGPMTVAMLMKNTVKAYRLNQQA